MDKTCTVTNLSRDRIEGSHFATASAAVRAAKGFGNTDDVFCVTRNADNSHVAYISRGEEIDYTV